MEAGKEEVTRWAKENDIQHLLSTLFEQHFDSLDVITMIEDR